METRRRLGTKFLGPGSLKETYRLQFPSESHIEGPGVSGNVGRVTMIKEGVKVFHV